MSELSFSMIKPDAVERNIIGSIISMIEDARLIIIAQKMITISQKLALQFYAEHKHQVFFDDLVSSITSYPVVVQILRGNGAVLRYRELIGATDPRNAAVGTIRNKYGLDIQANSVHGSDNIVSAKREIGLFFSQGEIFQR